MSEHKPNPPSLVQCFDAPNDYRSTFGWICGFSAEPDFLNEALERFTRDTKDIRAERGYLSIALMLDPGNRSIKPTEVPGLAHLPFGKGVPPFRLLHAKVALLGFNHIASDGRWLLRLIVSTGNWTRQTLEESLDLAWSIEIRSEELQCTSDDLALRCADMRAAWSTFTYLQKYYDTQVLDASRDNHLSETRVSWNALAEWLSECSRHAGPMVRYRDNQSTSFLDQLCGAIEMHGATTKRSYIAMGSGFFESAVAPDVGNVPTVLEGIVARLTAYGLLAKKPTVDLYINPAACQAVAGSASAIRSKGWKIRPASMMPSVFGQNSQRALHAKFLFSAQQLGDDLKCHRPWIYLGSGNLTGPGFANKMSRQGGNLEAGVIFFPEELEWPQEEPTRSPLALNHFLPIQRHREIGEANTLYAGVPMPERGAPFLAPPLAWLAWQPIAAGGKLIAPCETSSPYEILDPDGRPCERSGATIVWFGSCPRQVRIRWQSGAQSSQCWIPIMDELGRLASAALSALCFDEAWSALENFPAAVNEQNYGDDEEENEDDDMPLGPSTKPFATRGVAAYPVRQMMELVERIAARQTALSAADWTAWCARLEQTLSRLGESTVLAYFHTLGLNPLDPLRVPAFRPDFAESGKTPEGRLYEAVLARIDTQWQTANLLPMEGGLQ